MSIQPGVGFNFKESRYGTTLDIEQGWTAPIDGQPVLDPVFPGEVGIDYTGVTTGQANVQIAKMRVLIQDRWDEGTQDLTTAEYAINGLYAYPTGSKTAGTDTGSIWLDNGAKYKISNAASGGADIWYVCIIRQPMNKTGNIKAPALVLIADGSDAYDKTTPWGEADTTDCIRLLSLAESDEMDVDGTPYAFIKTISNTPTQYNYNCQRVVVAKLQFSGSTLSVAQHMTGTITLPNIVQFFGTEVIPTGDPSPPTAWPQYGSECDAWNGTWTGYTKASPVPSDVISPIGF